MAQLQQFVCPRTQYDEEIPDHIVAIFDAIKEVLCESVQRFAHPAVWADLAQLIPQSVDFVLFSDLRRVAIEGGELADDESFGFWGRRIRYVSVLVRSKEIFDLRIPKVDSATLAEWRQYIRRRLAVVFRGRFVVTAVEVRPFTDRGRYIDNIGIHLVALDRA